MRILYRGVGNELINTVENIKLSNNIKNIDGIMIDVRASEDNVLVIYDEDYITKNKFISNMDYKKIKNIKLKYRAKKYYIPRLLDVINIYKKTLVLRVKHNYDNNDILVDLLNDIKRDNIIIVTDNDHLYKLLIKKIDYPVFMEDNTNFDLIDNYGNTF